MLHISKVTRTDLQQIIRSVFDFKNSKSKLKINNLLTKAFVKGVKFQLALQIIRNEEVILSIKSLDKG